MYKVYAEKLFSGGRVLIYMNGNISDDTKALSPKLTLSENNAGDFTIKLPSTNAGYDFVDRLDTLITVEKDNEEIWKGRIITIKEDFKKNKTITCEGEFAYLNDTIQPQEEYLDQTLRTIYEKILNNHNSKDARFGTYKQFKPGTSNAIENTKVITTYTNYETTMKALNDKFLENYGGYFHIRKNNGSRYLDYIPENQRPVSSQVIEFGTNLLDFTKSYDATDFCTVILPLGARINDEYGIDEGEIDKVQAYTTIELVNVGSPYLVNGPAVEQFGWIERVVHFDDIDDPYALYWAAVDHMKEIIFEKLVLEVNAVDLGYFGADYKSIALSEKVRVKSKPHDLDMYFPVKKISIPLDNPANTTFTIGNAVKSSLTLKTVVDQGDTDDKLDRIPTEDHTLMLAKRKAAEIIDSFTMGFITIIKNQNGSQELYVTDTAIPERYDNIEDSATYIANLCQHYWRWNLHGLAYYNKNDVRYNNPKGLRTAITMDGAIVADFLTVGKIQGGKSYWNLSTGEFYLDGGVKINIGDSSTLSDWNKNLTTSITAVDGKIETEISNRQSEDGKLTEYYSGLNQTVNGINATVSTITTDLNGNGGIKSRVGSLEINYNRVTAKVSDIETNIDGDGGLKERIGKVEVTATNVSSTVSSLTKTDGRLDQMQSQINQNKENITAKVSKSELSGSVTTTVESVLSINPNNITFKTNKLIVNATNFTLTEDGTLTTKSATLNNATINNATISKGTLSNAEIKSSDDNGRGWIRMRASTIDGGKGKTPTDPTSNEDDPYGKINFANVINGKAKFLQLFARGIALSSDVLVTTESRGNGTVHTGATGYWGVTGSDGKKYDLHFIHGLFIESILQKGQ